MEKGIIIDSKISKLKVTAVQFIDKQLLIGIGGTLLVYKLNNLAIGDHSVVVKKKIFNHNIYGIIPDKTKQIVALHGGKNLTVCNLSTLQDADVWISKDWIWHTQWMIDDNIALITGHNDLLCLNWTEKRVLKEVSCEEKCILYSALIIGNKWDDIVVLAGTVYKEVLIWSPSCNEDGLTILHRLKGHKGVIFSVNYDFKSRRISTTSDDRTVRIWNIFLDNEQDFHKDIDSKGYPLTLREWRKAVIKLYYTAFGHLARVWRSCMISEKRIITIGEDSFLCVWDADGNRILRYETHQGGSVCCMAYSKPLNIVVTGGTDGGVSLWQIPSGTDHLQASSVAVPPLTPSRVVVTDSGDLIVTSRNGTLLRFSGDEWHTILNDERIVNYCLSDVSPGRKYIALATIEGHLIVLTGKKDCPHQYIKIVDKKISDGKIYSLHWLTESSILCCGNQGVLTLWSLSKSDFEEIIILNKVSLFLLPPSRERWLTAAVQYCNTVISGDRCGSIHVYCLDNCKDDIKKPIQTLHKIHGRLGVSSLCIHNKYIWSTGRDGTLRQFYLDEYILKPASADKLMISWAAKIICTKNLGILVIGFHEMNLVVWSGRSRVILWKFKCGGGHREWDCVLKCDKLSFYYLKDKSVYCISKKLEEIAYPPLIDGFHFRDVNAMTVLCAINDSSVLVASGGEDTTVRVSLMTEEDWKPIQVLSGHLSSIRAISVLKINLNDSETFLLFTAGGRAQMKIWKILVDYNDPSNLRAAEICSHMLRGEEKVRRPWRELLPTIDPETRYMDLSTSIIKQNEAKSAMIYAACSDGYLRLFCFDIDTNKIELMYLFEYNRCLLKTFLIELNSHMVISTTSTDGMVSFWQTECEKPFSTLKLHQSGINCTDCINLEKHTYLLVTGGDDSSVIVSLFTIINSDEAVDIKLSSSWVNSHLHSSQVTGVKIIENMIITAGVDQRINVLNWKIKNSSLVINITSQHCSLVADIHGIEVWRKCRDFVTVCVYGVGTEVIYVNTDLLNKQLNL